MLKKKRCDLIRSQTATQKQSFNLNMNDLGSNPEALTEVDWFWNICDF